LNQGLKHRRDFFDAFNSRPNERAAAPLTKGARVACPCCGYPTIDERNCFEICLLCSWEDDGQDDADADDVLGGPNGEYSLTNARSNFEQYLVMYSPEKDLRISGPDTVEARTIKKQLIAIFDQMMTRPNAAELTDLWREVTKYERSLHQVKHSPLRE
jgi:hypothetical protein